MQGITRIQQLNEKELGNRVPLSASWHCKYAESHYVFIGGIPYEMTEDELLTVFAQCGETTDCYLPRDTDGNKGYAFVAYEDQRSTVLAVDNLNGVMVSGRFIKVDHSWQPKGRHSGKRPKLTKKLLKMSSLV